MFVDACVIVAILADEPEAAAYGAALDDSSPPPWTSALAAFEAVLVLARPERLNLSYRDSELFVLDFLKRQQIELKDIGAPETVLRNAVMVADRHGTGKKKLSTLDCFHYAAAKTAGSPMLTLDKLLRETDVPTLP